jgi:signal transduction histidine kinase
LLIVPGGVIDTAKRGSLATVGIVGVVATGAYAVTSDAGVVRTLSTLVVGVLAFVALAAFGARLARTEPASHVALVAAAGVVTAGLYLALVVAFYARLGEPLGGVSDSLVVALGIASIGTWFGTAPAHLYLRQRRQTVRLRELNEELRATNETLREQNDRLDEFASMLSHDLRNPLTVARGYVDITTETGNLDHLEEVQACHDRIETLVDQVLALARMERDPDAVAPVDVAGVATDALETVDVGTGQVVVDVDCTTPAERSDLRQLFENCYRNSVEHAGPNPTIRVTSLEDARGFAIEDDGPGIPERERDAVLDRGYSNADSTGLGLAIVSEIAATYDWQLAVVDGTDGGARFEFRTERTGEDAADAQDADRSGDGGVTASVTPGT